MLLSELAIFLVVCVLGCEAGIQPPAHTSDYAQQRQIEVFKERPKSQAAGEWKEKRAQIGKNLVKFVKKTSSSINQAAKNMQESMKEQSIVPFEGSGRERQPESESEEKIDFEEPLEYALLPYDKLKKYSKKTFIWSENKPFDQVLVRLQKMRKHFHEFENELEQGMTFEDLLEFGEQYKQRCNDEAFYRRLLAYREKTSRVHRGLHRYLGEAVKRYQAHCGIEQEFERQYTEFVENHLEGINFIREKIRDATSHNHNTLVKFSSDKARGFAIDIATRILNGGVGSSNERALVDRTCTALIDFGKRNLADALIPDKRLKYINNQLIRDYQSLKEICFGAKEQMRKQPYSVSEYYVPDPVDYTVVY